jgi:phosphatidylcholine synthase
MSKAFTSSQIAAAWAVHAFTSSGIVAGFMAIVAISEQQFLQAFLWLWVAVVIDGVDGTFARLFRVTEVLPQVSGKTIDYVVDFATYAIIPAYLVYAAKINGQFLLPEALRLWAAIVILLVSALYYGKDGMVSNDYYFVGFPVMWNLVAFYLYYIFELPAMGNFIAILVFAILHFVPIKYLYPSRTQKFKWANLLNTLLCLLSCLLVLILFEQGLQNETSFFIARLTAIATLLYFGALGIYHTYFDPDTKGI